MKFFLLVEIIPISIYIISRIVMIIVEKTHPDYKKSIDLIWTFDAILW